MYLIREGYREGGKFHTRPIANIMNWPVEKMRIVVVPVRGNKKSRFSKGAVCSFGSVGLYNTHDTKY